MKFFILASLCVVSCVARPNGYNSYEEAVVLSNPVVKFETPSYAAAPVYSEKLEVRKFVPIVRLAVEDDNYGTFTLDAESGDGTVMTKRGQLRNLGDPEGPVSVMSGSYSYIGDDGRTYVTQWTADENGFRATGDHLPTPPPVPAEIVESLRVSSYDAPEVVEVRSGYEAPAVVKVSSAPLSYSAPVLTEVVERVEPTIIRLGDSY